MACASLSTGTIEILSEIRSVRILENSGTVSAWVSKSEFLSVIPVAKVSVPLDQKDNLMSTMKLYVGNLSFSTSEQDLHNLFAQSGQVESASVITDRETGRSRGFGFVEMASRSEGEAAISQFNGYNLDGRTLKVNEANPQTNRSNNRNGFSGNRGGNGNRRFNSRY